MCLSRARHPKMGVYCGFVLPQKATGPRPGGGGAIKTPGNHFCHPRDTPPTTHTFVAYNISLSSLETPSETPPEIGFSNTPRKHLPENTFLTPQKHVFRKRVTKSPKNLFLSRRISPQNPPKTPKTPQKPSKNPPKTPGKGTG